MSVYIYNISTQIPGGQFTGAMKQRLTLLIAKNITTPLNRIQIAENNLNISFTSSLTSAEKALLDGDTQNPAGGLIADSTQQIALFVDNQPKVDNLQLNIPADRITFKTIKLQKQNYDGTPAAGSNELVAISSVGVVAISSLDGQLNESGEFTFILGPDVRRGSVNLTIGIEDFSSKPFSVRFH